MRRAPMLNWWSVLDAQSSDVEATKEIEVQCVLCRAVMVTCTTDEFTITVGFAITGYIHVFILMNVATVTSAKHLGCILQIIKPTHTHTHTFEYYRSADFC